MALEQQMHFAKSYDEFLQVLKEHENGTGTKYILVTGMKRFNQKHVSLGDSTRIHWLENMPYFHCGTRIFSCHQGKDRNQSKKRKYALERNLKASKDKSIKPYSGHRETKKLDCPVLIHLTRIIKVLIRHPEYPSLERYPKRHMKRVYALLIKERISQGKLNVEEYYMFNLPKPEEHMYHFVGEEAITKALTDSSIRKPKKSSLYCCVCKSSKRKNEHLSFHRVPKAEKLLNKWRQVIGKNVKSDIHRVCSDHFPPSQYKEEIMENGKKRKVLLPNSVPRVEKYSEVDPSNHEEPEGVTSSDQPAAMEQQSSIVPLEHLYCALGTAENIDEEQMYYEEVEVALEDFEISYVDDINSTAVSEYLPVTIDNGIPEYSEENVQESAEEFNEENIEESQCFEVSAPENSEEVKLEHSDERNTRENTEEINPECTEEIIPEYTEEIIPEYTEEIMPEYTEEIIPEYIEESESVVESLKKKYKHRKYVTFNIQKHKSRKLLHNNKKYELVENIPILLQDKVTVAPDSVVLLRQPLNQINAKEQSVPEVTSVTEEPKTKRAKHKEELTEECFTSPEYFQVYQRNKRKLKTEVTHYKSQLIQIESKYAQLNSIVSHMKEQGIISDPPLEKYLSPLMCNIVDRALFGNKLKVTPELKAFSTSLMTQSSNTYQFVSQELMHALPKEETVKSWLKKAQLDSRRRVYVVKKQAPQLM